MLKSRFIILTAGVMTSVLVSVSIIGATSSASVESQPTPDDKGPKRVVTTPYTSTRYTIDTRKDYSKFIASFEEAVPPFDPNIVASAADWDEVVANTAEVAANGFLIYTKFTDWPWGKFSGMGGLDKRRGAMYLMGNHVIAETMYRRYPGVMAHAPLRLMIFENERGDAVFQIERPSDLFAAFGDKRITRVGLLLNRKLAKLLTVLDVPVPDGLDD